MDLDATPSLQRSASHHSTASARSQRSQTVRVKPRKYASYISSSASSIASSDKSLTSFPSFSPESPSDGRIFDPQTTQETAAGENGPRKVSDTLSTVESLVTLSPSSKARSALFDDAPIASKHVPGALHLASDEHIERLIARHGAVSLVRQIAEDLAERDAQMAALRRKTEQRERALRKIILECGISSLDLEKRLRTIETEASMPDDRNGGVPTADAGIEDLMNDAMTDKVLTDLDVPENEATIRVKDTQVVTRTDRPDKSVKGWKEYIWGGSTSRKSSRANSMNEDAKNSAQSSLKNVASNRPSVLQNGIFQPPDASSALQDTRSPSSQSAQSTSRKASPSFASLALKLVAGNVAGKDSDSESIRGRSDSGGKAQDGRASSTASVRTTNSLKNAPVKSGPKAIPAGRRLQTNSAQAAPRHQLQDRWDTMGASPQTIVPRNRDNTGPVEMDNILPPDEQPPALTYIYNNLNNQEFLTDRFGFIYDQRRRKRQREAAEMVLKTKRGSRKEMISNARSGISPVTTDAYGNFGDETPDSPSTVEEVPEDDKPPKRWQDYLKIATFPTELLSHTPSGSIPALEVMEGGEVQRSPSITSEERGFVPSATVIDAQPTVSVPEPATISKSIATVTPLTELAQEDTEPVKLLLQQLGEVHDAIQREKTVRWNDFLRKVRAERRREGEAAAAALATETRANRSSSIIMPEATLAVGEIIGVAGLGNKGKVGRAKWNEFMSLVLGGIPVAYRAKIWAECSGATALSIPGYYDDLVARSDAGDDPSIVAQIQMDIHRTLTDNIFFRKGPGVTKLNEVLLAYSRRNPEVGYCQGMNLITACLLLIMPTAEDAFWVLTSIIENILPQGYYDHSLLASRADQQVLRQYVAEILPRLSLHLDSLSIELEALTFQWFLSVFTDCLSAEALFRVWDVVLCTNDGSTFLFQVALALLKLNEQQLLQCTTPAAVYTYINHQMTNHAISIDGLIRASEGLRRFIKRDDVENRRSKAIEAEKNLTRQREARNKALRAERLAAAAAATSDSNSGDSTEEQTEISTGSPEATGATQGGSEEDGETNS
ncbi:rab-GTPase-TBC domain-containing protein [Xylogone sp. PMI_703]|nr:rab-GTPase-TBC domain-containing protein [Xylogone sp. PMI_703]